MEGGKRMGEYYSQVKGKQRGGDIQKTDEKNELGDKIGREVGKGGARWNG